MRNNWILYVRTVECLLFTLQIRIFVSRKLLVLNKNITVFYTAENKERKNCLDIIKKSCKFGQNQNIW